MPSEQRSLYCARPIGRLPPSGERPLSSSQPASRRPPGTQPDTSPAHPGHRSTSETRDTFSRLYEAYAGQVYRYLRSRTSTTEDAEELTSRTFLNALAHLEGYRGAGSNFGSWLMSIAHNLLANWYRERGRRPSTTALDTALDVPADTPGPEASLETGERTRRLRDVIRSLPEDRQQLLALKYVEGCTNAEIGRRMGRSEGAIKALHHRTLQQLHETLGDS